MFFLLFDARDMNTHGWMVEIAAVFKRFCNFLLYGVSTIPKGHYQHKI